MLRIGRQLLQISKTKGFHSARAKRPQAATTTKWLRILAAGTATGFLAYDAVNNDFTYTGAAWRFLRSVKTASLVVIDYMLLQLHEDEADFELQMKRVHLKSAKRLLDTCLHNGGLYIKVGQGFAAINHILPKEYTDTLALLQNECFPTTRADVQQVFLQDFGLLPEDIFCDFDYKPVAAASLAQVFKAKLKDSGESVAVKVQYSDLQKRFTSDLGTIIFLQDIIEFFFKSYNFGWILRDLQKNLVQELDFVHEGQNCERCAKDLQKFAFVHVPKVHWDLTKRRVLTLEWIDGHKISDMKQLKQQNLSIRDVDLKLFRLFAEQIFNTGFVHADPHPGNIFVRKSAKTGHAELVLLDHGLYEELPEQLRYPLCEFWEAAVLKDENKMQAAARQMHIHDYMRFAEVLFQQPIRIHGGRIKTKLTQQDIDYMQELAKKNFESIMNTLKEMPRNMLFVVRNLNTVRAIGTHHGDIVDRPKVMARHAQHCLHARYKTMASYLRWLYRRMHFEYCLWSTSIKMSCLNLYFNLLYKLGRAPEAARTLMHDLVTQNKELIS